jgi:hypothetical protein
MMTFVLPPQDPTGAYGFPGLSSWESCAKTHYLMLRAGRVSVVIRRLVHHNWHGSAGERLSWVGTSYIARDRYSTERVFLSL